MQNTEKKEIPSTLYDKQYYLDDNDGCREYLNGLDEHMHPKFERPLALAEIKEGDKVLDVGCGRGELSYYCAKRGAEVLALDYSEAGVKIAKETVGKLPEDIRDRIEVDVADIAQYELKDTYDYIFMIETAEHMFDWQLEKTFKKFNDHLAPNGKVIITTPNYYYESRLQPLKLFLDIPCRFFKWPLRIVRGKYKPKSFGELIHKIFHIHKDRGEKSRRMHGNVMTPKHLGELLSDFKVDIWCEDYSVAPISMIMKKWWGLHLIAVAKKK